jgi:SAM-dependent methyltransferase
MTNSGALPNFFGPDTAARYDDSLRGDEAETVDFLVELARVGPVLELAIGTGRIALPLAERGIQVDGIELSDAMIARLREKPGGDQLAVTQGDMAEVALDATYRLIYLVYNTIGNLITQDAQVRCFENAARHLTEDGVFVVEIGTPGPLYKLRDHQYVDAESVAPDQVSLDVARYDPVTQILNENHVTLTADGIRLGPIVTRSIWPSEMDLMARIAGLRLVDRWGGWKREPFDAYSVRHVSVYGR